MNRIIKTITLFSAVVLGAASCSKWTAQESIPMVNTTLESKNPDLYDAYIQSLVNYRHSDHKLAIARVDVKAENPSSMADHLTAMPDSIDIFVINNIADLNDKTRAEIIEVRNIKNQKTLACIDFNDIATAYKAYLEGLDPETEPMEYGQFIKEASDTFVALVKKEKLDGIYAVFTSINPKSLNEKAKAEYAAIQTAFFAPLCAAAETDMLLLVETTPRYIITEEKVLEIARGIILNAESATNMGGFESAVYNAFGADVPMDKFIVGVTAVNVYDPDNSHGYFSSASSAIVGGAQWVAAVASGYNKLGICINHAQYDYYHMGSDYCEIKSAISIMNPSPVK